MEHIFIPLVISGSILRDYRWGEADWQDDYIYCK